MKNKINCLTRDQSLSDLLCRWIFLQPRCNGGRQSTFAGNSALLPSDVIDVCNVAHSEILEGNIFIVRCHVTSK